MKDRLRNAQRQLVEREVESANLMQQVAILGINWSHSSATGLSLEMRFNYQRSVLGLWCSIAVKQIHEAIVSPHNQSLFWWEIDIASRCCHPCLLQFIGATNDEGTSLYVTELMETSFRQLLEQRSLSKTEISVIALDVAQALNYLHLKKPPIIHSDISSGNMLL